MFGVLSIFQLPDIWLFIAALCFLMFSLYSQVNHRYRFSVTILFLSAFCIRLFMALQDPFLHEWDERFHALVARNMMGEPFVPTLLKYPIVEVPPGNWVLTHIWLHKQPLFMWQMALSMKMFGVSVYSIRYPSVLLGALMVPMLYDLSYILTSKRDIAWVTAVIFCFCGFQLQQISGIMGMDHNDVAFSFYILASIWAYAKYTQERKLSYAILVGLFSGMAILVKWLTGLVVYTGWGMNILRNIKSKKTHQEIRHLLVALLVTFVVFIPWQIYIHHAFPIEARMENELNAKHVFEVVEGHGGTVFFYIDNFINYFGEIGWMLVLYGFFYLLIKMRNVMVSNVQVAFAIMCVFTVVFAFFSFVVKTKVIGFFFIVAPIGCLFISLSCIEIRQFFRSKGYPIFGKVIYTLVVTVVVISILNPEHLGLLFDPKDKNRINKIGNASIYRNMNDRIPKNLSVVMNVNNGEEEEAMFYNPNLRVFSKIASKSILDSILKAGENIAVFEARPNYELPDSFYANSQVHVIPIKLNSTKYLE